MSEKKNEREHESKEISFGTGVIRPEEKKGDNRERYAPVRIRTAASAGERIR